MHRHSKRCNIHTRSRWMALSGAWKSRKWNLSENFYDRREYQSQCLNVTYNVMCDNFRWKIQTWCAVAISVQVRRHDLPTRWDSPKLLNILIIYCHRPLCQYKKGIFCKSFFADRRFTITNISMYLIAVFVHYYLFVYLLVILIHIFHWKLSNWNSKILWKITKNKKWTISDERLPLTRTSRLCERSSQEKKKSVEKILLFLYRVTGKQQPGHQLRLLLDYNWFSPLRPPWMLE